MQEMDITVLCSFSDLKLTADILWEEEQGNLDLADNDRYQETNT